MKTILVIEDEQTVRESILDLLEAEGFQGIGGENGNMGVTLAREHHPDLILCDVQMPDLDGYSVLTHLRKSPETAGIPFIFLTARSTKSDIRYGMELGADDYLTKPCTATELLGAISGRLAKQSALLKRFSRQAIAKQKWSGQPRLESSQPSSSDHASGTRDGLLNHFYQELRNPLSNINMAIHLLKTPSLTVSLNETIETVQREYERELAILQQVYKLQDSLIPESAQLLQSCNLVDLFESEIDESEIEKPS
ncbi:response regulator [Phormidesmis priestleyi]